jgi:hypothetical protein
VIFSRRFICNLVIGQLSLASPSRRVSPTSVEESSNLNAHDRKLFAFCPPLHDLWSVWLMHIVRWRLCSSFGDSDRQGGASTGASIDRDPETMLA